MNAKQLIDVITLKSKRALKTTTKEKDKYYSFPEVQILWGIGPGGVRKYWLQKKIKGKKFNGIWHYLKKDVDGLKRKPKGRQPGYSPGKKSKVKIGDKKK